MFAVLQSKDIEMVNGIKKQVLTLCCLQEMHLTDKTIGLEWKGVKRSFKQMDPRSRQK
jgi:hypothetical protein